jgi:hypothetical protein
MPTQKAAAPVTGRVHEGHEDEQVGAKLASVGSPPLDEFQLIVTPIARSPGRFMGRLGDGRVVVTSSSTPFFAAARALLAAGVHPGCMLMMRHSTAISDSLRATISAAAGLTVDEHNGTLFAPWKPFLRSAFSAAIAPKASGPTRTANTATKAMGEAMAETSAMLSSRAIETTTIAISVTAETIAVVAASAPADEAAIKTTTIAPSVPITTAPAIKDGDPKVEATTIAMSATAEMIGFATISASLRKVEPNVVVTTFPKQDVEGGGHGQ